MTRAPFLAGETEHRRRNLRFRDFRSLCEHMSAMALRSGDEALDPSRIHHAEFPKTYTKSMFGRTLTTAQLSKRFTMLAAWLEALDLQVDKLDVNQHKIYDDFLYGADGKSGDE